MKPAFKWITPPMLALCAGAFALAPIGVWGCPTITTSCITEWNDVSRSFEVDSGRTTEAHVSTFYYPHWTATAYRKVLPTRPAADGALLIALPPERVTVDLRFQEPARAKLSGVVSIFSWTLLASLLIFGSFVSQSREPGND